MNHIINSDGYKIPYKTVHTAMAGKPYTMELPGNYAKAVMEAVNQGIDGYLEACFCPDRGDSYTWGKHGKLECVISKQSLPTLIRRLYEMAEKRESSEEGFEIISLADLTLRVLGINEYGKLVGPLACGIDL